MPRLLAAEASGKVAVYDLAPGGGDVKDPSAPCNRPLLDPINWLPHIYFHSDFNYLELAPASGVVTINHPIITNYNDTRPTGDPAPGQSYRFSNYRPTAIDHGDYLLANHGLGYVPRFKVAVGNEMIAPGFPAQLSGGIGTRWVIAYATATQIRLKEIATRQAANVAAISLDYNALVFVNQSAPSGKLWDFDEATGILKLGRGRWASNKRYLQIVPGGSPFSLTQGRNIDLANGVARVVTANLNVRDSMVAGVRLQLFQSRSNSTTDGGLTGYTGSFAGSPAIAVQAP